MTQTYPVYGYSIMHRIFNVHIPHWLGRTSPKWPILCRVGHKSSLNQSQNHRNAVNSSAFTYRILTAAQTQTDAERPKNTEALATQTRHKLLDQLHSSGIQPTSWLLYESHLQTQTVTDAFQMLQASNQLYDDSMQLTDIIITFIYHTRTEHNLQKLNSVHKSMESINQSIKVFL